MKFLAPNLQVAGILVLVSLLGMEPIVAETPGAMLTPTGATTVNGQPVSGNAVIFPGDILNVTSGTAILRPKQFIALLDPHTQAVYREKDGRDSLDFKNGSGTITLSDKDASIRYLGLTVTPREKFAKVVIGLEHGRPAIMASTGALLLTKGMSTMTLEPGSAIVQDQQPASSTPGQTPAPQTQQPPAETVTPPPPSSNNDDFCSEENQNKDKKRRKKCGAPEAAFADYHVIRDAVIAAAILGIALYAFGAFGSNTPCATPTAPNQKCK